MVFVVDGSYKMGETDFTEVGNFINNVSRHFDVAINETWIVTSVEGNETNVYRTMAELSNTTLHFPNNSQVLLGRSLHSVNEQLSANDLQRDASLVVVLFASHKSDDDIAISSIDLKKMNATIFAVGIGDAVSVGQLKEIASNPDDQHFVQSNDTDDLSAKTLSLAIKICQGKYKEIKEKSKPFLIL